MVSILKKKNNKNIRFFIKKSISVFLLILVGFIILIDGVQDAMVLKNWSTTGLIEYTGVFEFEKRKPLRSTYYHFTLENGEEIMFFPENFSGDESIFLGENELCFKYSSNKWFFRFNKFEGVSISTLDGRIIQSEEIGEKDVRLGAIIGVVLGSTVILITTVPFIIFSDF